jgi:REP element-mobilizing transposase RayT
MQLEGIGELSDQGTHWHLVYNDCRHDQLFAREGLEDLRRAIREVRRYFAECLSCRLAARAAAPDETAA